MSFMETIIFIFAWFLAGLVNGISGMGAAMVALPFISAFMTPQEFVPVSCIIVTIISANMAWNFRQELRFKSLKALFIGTIPGSAAGLGLLMLIPAATLQIIIGCTLLLFVVWQCTRSLKKQHNAETWTKGISAGFCSGVMNTSISFGNPPVGIYALHLGWGHRESVGTMNMFSTGAYIIACVMQAAGGLYTAETLTYAAWGIPAAMVGILCSLPIVKHINTEVFRRILLFVIAVSGCVCIIRVLA